MRHRFLLCLGVALGVLVPSASAFLLYYHRQSKNMQSKKTPKTKTPLPFKLLKLPRIALQQVLKSMNPRDIFMLSLCSKNTFNILRAWKTIVNWLCYRDYQNELWVYSRRSFDTKDFVFSMRIVSKLDRGVENALEVVKVTIGGVDVQCLFRDYGIDYCDKNGDTIQQAVDNHIHQLFTVEYIDLELSANNIHKKIYPNITSITDLMLYDATMNPRDLEEILEKYPNLKSVRIDGQINGRVSANSRIFNMESIELRKLYQSAPFFWNQFQGRHAVLGNGDYNETDVLGFVNDWISGRRYLNLEVMFVTKTGVSLDFEEVLEELSTSAMEWNRPSVYKYWSRIIGSKRNRRERVKFASLEYFREEFLDFERETDQKMATLMISDNTFNFLVWNISVV